MNTIDFIDSAYQCQGKLSHGFNADRYNFFEFEFFLICPDSKLVLLQYYIELQDKWVYCIPRACACVANISTLKSRP